MKKGYVSGKVSGIELEAVKLFEKAGAELKLKGYEPVNPMELNHNHDKSWASYMKEDIKALCDCDAIYMLTNWSDSRGAKVELEIARCLEMEVIYQDGADNEHTVERIEITEHDSECCKMPIHYRHIEHQGTRGSSISSTPYCSGCGEFPPASLKALREVADKIKFDKEMLD